MLRRRLLVLVLLGVGVIVLGKFASHALCNYRARGYSKEFASIMIEWTDTFELARHTPDSEMRPQLARLQSLRRRMLLNTPPSCGDKREGWEATLNVMDAMLKIQMIRLD